MDKDNRIRAPRDFKQGERVVLDTPNDGPYKAMIMYDQHSEFEDDKIDIFVFLNEEDDDSSGIDTKRVKACNIYQLSKDEKVCPLCGEPLYDEHLAYMDYPYYCPWCQENFYGIEV